MGLFKASGTETFYADGSCDVMRLSMFSGKENTQTMRATADQFKRWRSGVLIQDAFPSLTREQREFILTGATPQEWASLWPPEQE